MALADKIEAQRKTKQEAQERNAKQRQGIIDRMTPIDEEQKVQALIDDLNIYDDDVQFTLYVGDGPVYAIGYIKDGHAYAPLHYFPTCGEVAASMLAGNT